MKLSTLCLVTALCALCGALAAYVAHPAIAQGYGPYQLMQHSNTTANAGVFRIDTATGDVSYCYVPNTPTGEPSVSCTKPTR